ncbi:hypothetical protein ACHAWF_005143, partial [Thalassiosira exigua]
GPSDDLRLRIDASIASRRRRGDARADGTSSAPGEGGATSESPSLGEAGVPPPDAPFEYLDHPADVVLHAWGTDLPSALSNLAVCMFGYVTSLGSIEVDEAQSAAHGTDLTAEGHDLHSLVYSFLDEWLYNFHDSGFVPREVEVSELVRGGDEGEEGGEWRAASSGRGEVMDLARHPPGTEVKAITYSGMRVEEVRGRCDVYVVVDI